MSDVLLQREGACGHVTLNRPKAMNALTLDMVRDIYKALCSWKSDPSVEFVLIDGAGERGLCAGGDIRALYEYAVAGDLTDAGIFFREEYRLNLLIARYPKPYVALMDGVVMGGGVGLSAHGKHRVVTEKTLVAMPEASIGFLPDVGGTYLLGNAPDEFGTYAGLTGARLGAADAILCGLADIFVTADRLAALSTQLLQSKTQAELSACLRSFGGTAPTGTLEAGRAWIDRCFCANSIEEIVAALENSEEESALQALADIRRNSPTSLKVTLQALRKARELRDLGPCLQQEYSAGMHCLREGDFIEGVRAAVIDKDRKPMWNPASLADVSSETVEGFFTGDRITEVVESNCLV